MKCDKSQKYKQIVENSKDAIFMTDITAKIIYSNPSAEKMFGYKTDDLSGRNFFDIISPQEFCESYKQSFNYLISSLDFSHKTFEFSSQKKDGTDLALEISFSTSNLNDEISCIFSVRDVTERKTNEKALLEFQEIFNFVIETAHDAIVMLDNNGKIFYWNPVAEKIFGYEFIEVIDKDINSLFLQDKFSKLYKKSFNKIKKQEENIFETAEMQAIKSDDTYFNVHIRLSMIKINNNYNTLLNIHPF